MSLSRRRSDRPAPARRRRWSCLESLESRELLTGSINYYQPSIYGGPILAGAANLPVSGIQHPIGISDQQILALGNDGKVVSGRDRAGNTYTIAVYGPGSVIVTDTTPNDGVLDDDINSIQLVGTNPNTTHVIGTTSTSVYNQTNGEVLFNRLVAQTGVASIVLNGFVLAQTIPPTTGAPNSNTGIFLAGGARQLQFTGVQAPIDISTASAPVNIIIGDPRIPLNFKPNVRIDEISNTVFNSTTTIPSLTPNTVPTVNIVINGEAGNLQFASIGALTVPNGTNAPINGEDYIPAAFQYLFPIVGATGRTAIQAKGINNLSVVGSATNLTTSRTSVPFQPGFSGLSHLNSATFGGNADALALDVAGKIGKLTFNRGLGNPTGVSRAATNFGTPAANVGFAGNGLLGGLVGASSIGSVTAAPANVTLLTGSNPDNLQIRPGSTRYYAKAGQTLNNAAITARGNIGSLHVIGDSTNSEVKSGFELTSYTEGLSTTVPGTKIQSIKYRGDLVDSVISASVQPGALGYGYPGTAYVGGSLAGGFTGSTYYTGLNTALGNKGVGFYASTKRGYLPPPESPTRNADGVLIRP